MKVSVIVPVYKVEEYLSKCLSSLVQQELKDIEIIVVNDGSPDNSQSIIDKYQKNYPNIKSFIKDNSGLSDTRNMGIQNATGEYIAFVDSDDYVRFDMYSKMYSKAKDKDFDVVTCDVKYVYSDHENIVVTDPKNDTTNIKEAFIDLYPAACTKIFKREIITKNKIYFKSGVWYEDVEFMYRLLPYVKSIGVIHEPFYEYLQREKSITNSVSPKFYDYINNMNGVVDYYKEKGFYDTYKKELEYAYVRYVYATFIKTCLAYDKETYLKAVDDAIKNVNEHFPKYRRNKYFYKSLKGLYLALFSKGLAKLLYLRRGKNEKGKESE
jgi:glycosyltransferase involved in cell wall biosynthesis